MAVNDPSYRFESVDGYCAVTLNPSLNDVQWANIERIGSDILSQLGPIRNPQLIADLSALNYMGSAMVALVVRLWKTVNERGGRMVVVNKNEMVLEVLKLAGLANVWTIVGSRDEGIQELGLKKRTGSSAGGGMVAVLGLIAAAAALVFVFLPQLNVQTLPAETSRLVALGLAAAGLVLGAISAAKGSGGLRFAGVLAILLAIGAGAVALGAVPLPKPQNADAAKSG